MAFPSSTEIWNHVEHSAQANALDLIGDLGQPVYATKNSRVYKLALDQGAVAVKVSAERSMQVEFEGLLSAERVLDQDRQNDVPHPIALSDDGRVMLLEWVDGATTSKIYSKVTTSLNLANQLSTKIGDWIGGLHAGGDQDCATVDCAGLYDDIVIEERRLGDTPRGRSERAKTTLRDLIEQVSLVHCRAAMLHGDFKTSNVLLCSDGRIVGIDMTYNGRGPIEYDLAQFLNHLSLDLYSWSALRLNHKIETIERAFLDAYRASNGEVQLKALTWLRLQKYLLLDLQTKNRKSNEFRGVVLRAFLGREIQRLDHQLQAF